MKILFSHRYFFPDVAPYASLLRFIAKDISDLNHDCHVYCSNPSYRSVSNELKEYSDELESLNIHRCWVFHEETAPVFVRALNVIIYSFGLFISVLKVKPDVVTASTFPPVFAEYMASLGAKLVGAKFIYHVQDIHPEVSEISTGFMGKTGVAAIFRRLDNQTLRRSAAIIVLSKDMENTLKARALMIYLFM